MNPKRKIISKISASILGLGLIFALLGTMAPRPASAQFIDPITSIQTTIKNVFDGILKAYDFAEKHIGDAAAVAYKQALRGVLNTIAVETAKAIATGDWGAPVFHFDKGFFSALADAAVGDFLSTFVQQGIGIDLCNYQPDLTLPLIIPLLKLNDSDYKYDPKCTLSGIAANVARFDAKKSFKLSVSVQTFSFAELASSFNRLTNRALAGTHFKASYTELGEKYKDKDASPIIKAITGTTEEITNIKQKIASPEEDFTEEDKQALANVQDASLLENLKMTYRCGMAADIQRSNFAYYGPKIADCAGNDALGSPVPIWNDENWTTLGGAWVTDPATLPVLKGKIDSFANSSTDEFYAGMKRYSYAYARCYEALGRALDVEIVKVEPVGATGIEPVNTNLEKQPDGTYQQTFFSSNLNGVYGVGTTQANITYSQGGILTAEEYAACQVAYNGGRLMVYPTNSQYIQSDGFLDHVIPVELGIASDDLTLGDDVYLFDKNVSGAGPEKVNDFIFRTVVQQVTDIQPIGQVKRDWVLKKINIATAELLGLHEIFGKIYSSLTQLLVPVTDLQEEMTQDEKNKDQAIAITNPSANPMAAPAILTEAASVKSAQTEKIEVDNKVIDGSALNAETTAVSEQKKNVSEVNQNELEKGQKGEGSQFTEYTGKIFADSAGLFFEVLFNTALREGYKSLNNRYNKNGKINVPPDLQRQLQDQDESALVGYEEPGVPRSCSSQDLDILRAWANLKKSFTNISTSGSGALRGLSPECQKKVGEVAAANNLASDSPEAAAQTASEEEGAGNYIANSVNQLGQGIRGFMDTLNSRAGDTADSTTPEGTFASPFESDEGADNFNISTNFDLLTEMSICPTGEVNPSTYHCTINPSIKDAIVQKMTIREAIAKKLLSPEAILGISADGKVPDTAAGFSLAAAQKLRKARIMPIGFEFAARLKIACYQLKTFGSQGDYETRQPHGAYPWIGEECQFGLADPVKEDLYVNEVITANLQAIIDGYTKTGTLNEVCGNFAVAADGTTKMSPFCGLVNPDWVLKIPTPQCDVYAYNDVLEAQKGANRLLVCSELQSEVSPNNYGYCVKERNSWNITGQSCPAQYSTCSTFVFGDGSLGSFNKDSLAGEGLCSEKNAGCTWFSTIKAAGSWQDTQSARTSAECRAMLGTWDGFKCTNSRIYLTGNVSTCSPLDSGCSKVFPLKQEGSNLTLNGSFEYSPVGQPPAFWNAYRLNQQASSACTLAGGSTLATCTINYPLNKQNLCTSRGGTLTNDGCELIITNAQPTQCGYCSLGNGTEATVPNDRSGQVFNPTDCLLLNTGSQTNYRWYFQDKMFTGTAPVAVASAPNSDIVVGGNIRTASVFSQLCQLGQNLCPGLSTCPLEVVGPTSAAAKIPTTGVSSNQLNGLRIDLSRKVCSISNQDCTDATIAEDCPAVNGVAQSCGLVFPTADDVVIEYPLQTIEAGSTMILAGDAFSVGFDLKSNDLSAPLTIEASLIKTFNGGRVDSRTIAIPLSSATEDYRRYTISLTAITDGTDLKLRLTLPQNAGQIFVDAVKIEYNSPSQLIYNQVLSGNYSEYELNQPLSVKLAPDYLNCRGYAAGNPSPRIPGIATPDICANGGFFWDTFGTFGATPACYRYAPDDSQCANFAPACRPDEAGCQLYTPTDGRPGIPGVIGQDNYCPNECVGYAAYKQQPSYFERTDLAPINYFIPSTARQCTVDQVGCDEFTNLAIAAGGNPIEHYSYLKQCIIPDTDKGEAGFFIWQGSADGPPQLRTFLLQAEGGVCSNALYNDDPLACKNNNGTFEYDGTGGPAVISSGACSTVENFSGNPDSCISQGGVYSYETGGYCEESDLGIDLDCLRFFDQAGNEHFVRQSYTIEANDQCTVLRKTTSTEATCESTNGRFENGACFYDVLPSQSRSCQAEVSGCREYLGTTGANSFNQIFDNFEGTGDSGWTYADAPAQRLVISSESITTLGHSLFVTDALDQAEPLVKPVQISKGRAYNLSFWAKNSTLEPKSIGVKFTTANAPAKEFVTIASNRARIDNNWRFFQFGPIIVDWDAVDNNSLRIENAGGIFIDNITLTALQSSTFIVKDTWNTPASCDLTNLGVPQPQAQLGCQTYTNSSNQTVNLKSFSKLCRETSIGCQLVFDTNNSNSSLSASYNLDNTSPLDDLIVPADSLKAVVVNANTSCSLSAAGCTTVGTPNSTLPELNVINNPELYTSATTARPILCKNEELGCKKLNTLQGEATYLKIEFDNLCSYIERANVTRINSDGSSEQITIGGWFKDGQEGEGCASTPDSQIACIGGDKVWNAEYNQCTSRLPQLSFGDCSAFSADYKADLQDSCAATYKGHWFDETTDSSGLTNSCGCAKYPFEYYKNYEFPEHQVLAAQCPAAFDQCTEFMDFNPNYVANGDFENVNDLDNTPMNWRLQNAQAGAFSVNQALGFNSSTALEVFKRTERDNPVAGSPSSIQNTPAFIYQRLARLEKGKTYELNFKFKTDTSRIGVVAPTDTQSDTRCFLPQAAVEAVPYYDPAIIAEMDYDQNFYINHNNLKVFEPITEFKDAKISFIVPTTDLIAGADSATCDSIGGFFRTGDDETPAGCYASNPDEPTLNYEVRIYAPLNGACVNDTTKEKRYFYDNGSVSTSFNRASCEALEPVGAWHWEGNCIDSSYLVDNFQIALAQDHIYHFIDDQTLQRGNCTAVNWDEGCISFTNKLKEKDEIIQVRPDRQCSEWLFCESRDTEGRCEKWGTCQEQNGDACVRPGSTQDPLRYKYETSAGESRLQTIDITNYRKRLGISEEFRINRWRAGDYDGYTIPDLPPIEQMYNRIPGTVTPVEGTLELVDSEKKLAPFVPDDPYIDICRSYPEQSSPFPEFLNDRVPGFEGVNTIFQYHCSVDTGCTPDGISCASDERGFTCGANQLVKASVKPLDRRTICDYTKLTYQGQNFYIKRGLLPSKICVEPSDLFGTVCAPTENPTNESPLANGCTKCADTNTLQGRQYDGELGACIESDPTIKVYGGLSSANPTLDANGNISEDDVNHVNGPNACLTFFPR